MDRLFARCTQYLYTETPMDHLYERGCTMNRGTVVQYKGRQAITISSSSIHPTNPLNESKVRIKFINGMIVTVKVSALEEVAS